MAVAPARPPPSLLALLLCVAPRRARRTESTKPGWGLWDFDACGKCMGIDISELKAGNERDYHIGCPGPATDPAQPVVPECKLLEPTASKMKQAAGHADSFYKLEGGLVAKKCDLVETRADDAHRKLKVGAAKREWSFYMQLWCLRRLHSSSLSSAGKASLASAGKALELLQPFALGDDPWAPGFFGLCAVGHNYYLAMENLMEKYSHPSQLDLKIGSTTEPDHQQSVMKEAQEWFIKHASDTMKRGARVAGYSVWHPIKKVTRTESKTSQFKALESCFERAFKYCKYSADHCFKMLHALATRLSDMRAWWETTGKSKIHSYAASLLFVWEGDTQVAQAPLPTLKVIDFAHFYPAADHADWPQDSRTALGIRTAHELFAEAERLAAFSMLPHHQINLLK